MNCLYCGGKMEKTKSSYTINRKDYHLFLGEVPAYVCTKCKERLFEEADGLGFLVLTSDIGHRTLDFGFLTSDCLF